MGILEEKRKFKNNVIGNTVKDIQERAKEEREKSHAVIELNKVRKNIKNSKFDTNYNDLKNDLKYQDLKDTYTNKKCDMLIRQSKNKSKINLVKKDTSNILTNIINFIFALISGGLSMAGIILSYCIDGKIPQDAIIPSIIVSILMIAVTITNSCFIQNKLFNTTRLKKDIQTYIIILGYIIACSSCIIISIVTNRIIISELFKNCNIDELSKTILSFSFTMLFDIVPLFNNWSKFKFNMCMYNEKTNSLFLDQTKEKDVTKNKEKRKIKAFQNTINTDKDEPQKMAIGFNYDTQKTEQKLHNKAGRKVDKRTIESIRNKIEKLESGERITNKKINYNGSRNTLKRVCKEHLKNIEYRTDGNGNETMYKM